MRLWSCGAGGAEAAVGEEGPGPKAERPRLLTTLRTKATPVFAVQFSRRNLLFGSGALTLWPGAKRKLQAS